MANVLQLINNVAWEVLNGATPLFAGDKFVATMSLGKNKKVTYRAEYAHWGKQADRLLYFNSLGGAKQYVKVAANGSITGSPATTSSPPPVLQTAPAPVPSVTGPALAVVDLPEAEKTEIDVLGVQVPIVYAAIGVGLVALLIMTRGDK